MQFVNQNVKYENIKKKETYFKTKHQSLAKLPDFKDIFKEFLRNALKSNILIKI